MEEIQHTESQYGLRRQKKVTEKGLVYKKDTLFQRRSKMHSRLVRKSSAINDLLYSKENISMVKEEMCLLDDLFKMLMGLNNEYQQLLDESQREVNDDWFDELDQNVCTFKRKIHHWLKENNEDQQSIHTKGKMSSSKASSKSSASSKTSAKERVITERLHLAELRAEASFIEKKRAAEYQSETLKSKSS